MDVTSADPLSSHYDAHLDAEAQEDILLLKAHMGLFDAYLGKTEQEPHLVDPYPIERAQLMATTPNRSSTPEASRHSIVEILSDSDDGEPAKGESSKKRRADRPVIIDLEADDDDEEEDLEAMKMKRYNTAPENVIAPIAKRPCPLPLPTETKSAPATPIPSVKAKTMLIATGRYYDDTSVSNQVKNCRFCAAAHGITFHESNSSNGRMSCYNCGGPHIARECRNIMCYNCWEMGHRSHACTNPRAPKATCYRCGGQHEAIDCLTNSGVSRLGASESNKKKFSSEAVPLPPMCPNCGFSGHMPRDCRLASLEDTNHAFERDGPGWLPRMRREVQSMAARFKTPEKPSNNNNYREHSSKSVQKSPVNNHSQQPNHSNHSNHSNHKKAPSPKSHSKSLPNTPKASNKSHAQHNHQRHHPQSHSRPQAQGKPWKSNKSSDNFHHKKK